MNEDERKFFTDCDSWQDYSSIEEYTDAIRRWLMLSPWHYSDSTVSELLCDPIRKQWIADSFQKKEPVSDIAVNVGYVCG